VLKKSIQVPGSYHYISEISDSFDPLEEAVDINKEESGLHSIKLAQTLGNVQYDNSILAKMSVT
jgi:hypothetical protein